MTGKTPSLPESIETTSEDSSKKEFDKLENSLNKELVKLETRLKKDIEDVRNARDIVRSGSFWTMLLFGVFFSLLFAFLYLHAAGMVNLSGAGRVTSKALGEAGQQGGIIAVNKRPELRDLLTVLLPILAVFMGFIVSAAGMKRLQQYDNEFARMRDERREDARELRQELREEFDKFKNEVQKKIDDIGGNAERIIENIISDKMESFRQQLEDVVSDAEKSYEKFKDLKRYDPLLDYLGISQDFSDVFINGHVSVGYIYDRVTEEFSNGTSESRKKAIAYVRMLLDAARQGGAHGTPTDWFNLSTQLGRNDEEGLALNVCEAALKYYQGEIPWDKYLPNIDLLAHGIQYATKTARYDLADLWIKKAEKLGRNTWNWRLFVFIGDYYLQINNWNSFKDINDDFAKHYPEDPRVATQESAYFIQLKKYEQAKKVLEDWKENYRKKLKSEPRSVSIEFHISEVAIEQKDYQACLDATARAIAAAGEDQPSVHIPMIWMNRAKAYYGLLMEELYPIISYGQKRNGNTKVSSPCSEKAKKFYCNALLCYQRAMDGGLPFAMTTAARTQVEDMKTALRERKCDQIIDMCGENYREASNQESLKRHLLEMFYRDSPELDDEEGDDA